MVIPQYAGNLVRSFPFGAELEDTLDDALCLLVENPVFMADDGYSGTNFDRPAWQDIVTLMSKVY